MGIAFVCAMQDDWADDHHDTSFEMVRCAFCDEYAVAGYVCETCGHEDVDLSDQLAGHGPGKCTTAADVRGCASADGAAPPGVQRLSEAAPAPSPAAAMAGDGVTPDVAAACSPAAAPRTPGRAARAVPAARPGTNPRETT